MRCLTGDREETKFGPTALNIWTTTLPNPSILESPEVVNGIESKSCSDALSTLYTFDSVSQSCKRKILECEKDFEDRFSEIQRKRQMLRTAAKSDLVTKDEENDFDENDIYEHMEWIESGNNAMTLHLWGDKDVDLSLQSISSVSPIMYIPKFTCKEEKLHLLRISMAKIRCVDDPESYLRRSVLINNTVKRLQKDVAINYRFQTSSSSVIHEKILNQPNLENSYDEVVLHEHISDGSDLLYSEHVDDDSTNDEIYSDVQTSNQNNFQLSVSTHFTSEDSFQNEILHSSVSSKTLQDDLNVYDQSFSYRTVKQANSVQMYSSQPCGLQYRNAFYEATNSDYSESNSSSVLDSVVYHSLIASIET